MHRNAENSLITFLLFIFLILLCVGNFVGFMAVSQLGLPVAYELSNFLLSVFSLIAAFFLVLSE